MLDGIGEDGEIRSEAREQVMMLLRRSFRPEFLNRLDETVFYRPLTKENISAIIDLLTRDLEKRLAEKNLKLRISDSAKAKIIDESFDPVYGARPMKRYLTSRVETLIAKAILGGSASEGSTIAVEADEFGLRADVLPPADIV